MFEHISVRDYVMSNMRPHASTRYVWAALLDLSRYLPGDRHCLLKGDRHCLLEADEEDAQKLLAAVAWWPNQALIATNAHLIYLVCAHVLLPYDSCEVCLKRLRPAAYNLGVGCCWADLGHL
jgi:hypothetical protein